MRSRESIAYIIINIESGFYSHGGGLNENLRDPNRNQNANGRQTMAHMGGRSDSQRCPVKSQHIL
jgi:hypothetical protein